MSLTISVLLLAPTAGNTNYTTFLEEKKKKKLKMNYPSNPNPSSIDITEFFKFDDFEDSFEMIMEEIAREDYSSSPTLSWTSSEKLVAAEITSPVQTSLATSPMSLEM